MSIILKSQLAMAILTLLQLDGLQNRRLEKCRMHHVGSRHGRPAGARGIDAHAGGESGAL